MVRCGTGTLTATCTHRWHAHSYVYTPLARSQLRVHTAGTLTATCTHRWHAHSYVYTPLAASPSLPLVAQLCVLPLSRLPRCFGPPHLPARTSPQTRRRRQRQRRLGEMRMQSCLPPPPRCDRCGCRCRRRRLHEREQRGGGGGGRMKQAAGWGGRMPSLPRAKGNRQRARRSAGGTGGSNLEGAWHRWRGRRGAGRPQPCSRAAAAGTTHSACARCSRPAPRERHPPVALSRMGSPTVRTHSSASSALTSRGLPLSTGTSARSASSRAVCFWANMPIVSAAGGGAGPSRAGRGG